MTALFQVLHFVGISGRDLITYTGSTVMFVLALLAFLPRARR